MTDLIEVTPERILLVDSDVSDAIIIRESEFVISKEVDYELIQTPSKEPLVVLSDPPLQISSIGTPGAAGKDGRDGLDGSGTVPIPPATVLTGESSAINELNSTQVISCEWIVTLTTLTLKQSFKILAMWNDSFISHSRYAILGDSINASIFVNKSLDTVSLSILNNESEDLVVNAVRVDVKD